MQCVDGTTLENSLSCLTNRTDRPQAPRIRLPNTLDRKQTGAYTGCATCRGLSLVRVTQPVTFENRLARPDPIRDFSGPAELDPRGFNKNKLARKAGRVMIRERSEEKTTT